MKLSPPENKKLQVGGGRSGRFSVEQPTLAGFPNQASKPFPPSASTLHSEQPNQPGDAPDWSGEPPDSPSCLARNRIYLDFETSSLLNLELSGVQAYVEHKSTRVSCLSYAIGLQPVRTWFPGQPMPDDLRQAVTAIIISADPGAVTSAELAGENRSYRRPITHPACAHQQLYRRSIRFPLR
jgi:hypothetical protein